MNPDEFDNTSLSLPFDQVDFSLFKEDYQDSFEIQSKSSYAIEQVMTESLLKIWKLIFKSYISVKNTSSLDSIKIKDYVVSEITYARHSWKTSSLEKPIYNSLRRLKSFIQYLDVADPEEARKKTIKTYITRVIAIILNYQFRTLNEQWASRASKLLHSIIHSCEEQSKDYLRLKTTLSEESPTQVDIDFLISQLPENSQKTIQRQSKEKMSQALQSLIKDAEAVKTTPVNKNLLNSIYKDSKQFNYFSTKDPSFFSSYLDNVTIDTKRQSMYLENISSLESITAGKWDENLFARKANRNRTFLDKRIRTGRTLRTMTKDNLSLKEVPEEPVKAKKEIGENQENSEEEDALSEEDKTENDKDDENEISETEGPEMQMLKELVKFKFDEQDLMQIPSNLKVNRNREMQGKQKNVVFLI